MTRTQMHFITSFIRYSSYRRCGNLARRLSLTLSLGLMVTSLASCVTQKTLTGFGENYKKANQAAVDALSIEANQVRRVRRIAAVVAYIKNPNQKITDNFNRDQLVESFANFVCTGVADFEVTRAGLKYTSDYAAAVEAITKAPDDSIGGYVTALSAIKGKDKVLAVPEIGRGRFEKCRDEVLIDLPPAGFDAVTGQKENIGAVIAAVQATQVLITAVQTLIKDTLKVVTEIEQREVLRSFIAKNRTEYQAVLDEALGSKELQTAFDRRRKTAIALPYYTFIEMLGLSTANQQRQILLTAVEADKALSEYDAILVHPKPQQLAALFNTINQQLENYANNKISLADLIAFLSEFGSQIAQVKKDYDSVVTNVPTVIKAFEGAFSSQPAGGK